MIETRLSDLSSDPAEFAKVKEEYAEALSKSGFKENLEFKKSSNQPRKNRKRNIIWFNPFFFFFIFTSTDAPNLMLPFRILRLIRCKDLELSMQQGKGNNQLKDITQIANCTGKFMNKAKYTFFSIFARWVKQKL